MMKQKYLPEGCQLHSPQNIQTLSSREQLQAAISTGLIVEALAVSCNASHDLVVDLPCGQAIIPRAECALGISEGTTREIAILSRVGRPVCFQVQSVTPEKVILSRRAAQQQALDWALQHFRAGDVIQARITHLEPFGVFVDIGCGVISFIGIEHLSVSRIFHPSERFSVGQSLYAAVLCVDQERRRIMLTHRELLGTWMENAARFSPCETVPGVVRSIEPYGIFVELTPNLSGLAEPKVGIQNGDRVSVYIKSILPERMKIKLNIVDILRDQPEFQPPIQYYITQGRLQTWRYTPENCHRKHIETQFVAS